MSASSQKSSSSSKSPKKPLARPSASSKSKLATSSTSQKAHHGSRTSHNSSSSSTKTPSSRSAHEDAADHKSPGEAMTRYENEPRDYKSWAVQQYDAVQEQASEEHWDGMEGDIEGVEWAC